MEPCEYGDSVWVLSHFLCKKVILLLSKPSDQFLFMIIPLAFAFSTDVYSKRIDSGKVKEGFYEMLFFGQN